MGHININVDPNALLAIQQSAGQRLGRPPTVPEIWQEMIIFLQKAGAPPDDLRMASNMSLEFEILIK